MPNPFLILDWLRITWCDMFHGGGNIQRDEQGRINWRCAKCGRWSDSPVPLSDEKRMTDAAIIEHLAKAK